MVIAVLGGVVVALAVIKILDFHALHSWFWYCRHRTDTSKQARFEKLARFYVRRRGANRPATRDDVVTFEFDRVQPTISVEVPIGSYWTSVSYMHRTEDMCASVEALQTPWYWGNTQAYQLGPLGTERPGWFVSFGRLEGAARVASGRLTTSERGRQFYHAVCSAVQDAEIYFALCSTPAWIRALHALATLVPPLREFLIYRALWVQLRTIYYKGDFWEGHGRCTILRYLFWWPPASVYRFEDWSQVAMSEWVLWFNYHLGTNLMGMSSSYEEYEMSGAQEISKCKAVS